jgi:hypothetical protein
MDRTATTAICAVAADRDISPQPGLIVQANDYGRGATLR